MTFVFSDTELAFIKEQRIGRLATASPGGAPDVAPAMAIYRRSLGAFLLGGQGIERTRRYNNARRNPQASLVFDALSWEPYEPRGVKVAGSIEVHIADDEINLGTMGIPLLVMRPERKWSWGLEDKPFDDEGRFTVRLDDGSPRPV
jgi:pyridoxamine 5'-phosphate oxidase family protein